MEGVIPRPDVALLLRDNFVALAADADAPEEEVKQLAMRLENAMMLPFLIFADSEGRFLGGHSGMVTPALMTQLVNKLLAATQE